MNLNITFFGRMTLKSDSGVYLDRHILFECGMFGIYLHKINAPDPGRHLHDHPWSFISIVLRGRYTEVVPHGEFKVFNACAMAAVLAFKKVPMLQRSTIQYLLGIKEQLVRRVNIKKATDAHRIENIVDGPVWTLVLRGRKSRAWGFVTENGWVDADQYQSVLLTEVKK